MRNDPAPGRERLTQREAHGGQLGHQRVRNRFNVAVAEIDAQDAWQVVTLGIACLSDDTRHANEMLNKVIDFVESERLDAEVGDVDVELIAL